MKDNISDFPGSRIGKRFKVNRTCINRILNKYEALLK